jgi:hypothetical protein
VWWEESSTFGMEAVVEKDVQRMGLQCSNVVDRPKWRGGVRRFSSLAVKR